MPRFYLPPSEWDPERLCLRDAEAHHCIDVLRMQAGDSAILFNGVGGEASVEVEALGRREVRFRCVRVRQSPVPACRITLGIGVPKGKMMEWVVEKATELGAARVVPLLTRRSVVQIDGAERIRKQEKWQRVAVEAAKQCGQNWIPEVAVPQSLEALLGEESEGGVRLVGSLQGDSLPLRDVLRERDGGVRPSAALFLIGPEGDFDAGELRMAQERGVQAVSFGSLVLRCETAALYAMSILRHELLC